jgi:hypothetical protein
VLIVSNDPSTVETDLAAGHLTCPSCNTGVLARWGFARRRCLRDGCELRPRRGICPKPTGCGSTHVLLPDVCFVRRVDPAEVIGHAIWAVFVHGEDREDVAARLGVPPDTVIGWLRRFRRKALQIAAHFTSWLLALDPGRTAPEPVGSEAATAVERIAAAAQAASLRRGVRPVWCWASALSAGKLLSNTGLPWPGPN